MKYLTRIDNQVLSWAYQKSFKPSFAVKALIFMGDGPFWIIVVLSCALLGQFMDLIAYEQLAYLLIFGLIISNLIFTQLKTRVIRKRPYANIKLQKELNIKMVNRDPGHGSKELESFPSGHVLWTSLCVGLICFQFGWFGVFIVGWMVPAMIFLRLYLGVHYPSDVLAGLFLGSINAVITMLISSDLFEMINTLKEFSGYIYVYWVFIGIFALLGFKSWLKRV